MARPNVVLIGYRGTGKSTVAGILAGELGMEVVSTDGEIVRRAGTGIPEIVEARGWDGFRDLETEAVKAAAAEGGRILDCGGGAILREENRRALRQNGVVVWLRASVGAIADRIRTDDQRPSLTGGKSFVDEIGEVLAEREPIYGEACHFSVETDGKKPEEVADEILGELGRRGLREYT